MFLATRDRNLLAYSCAVIKLKLLLALKGFLTSLVTVMELRYVA